MDIISLILSVLFFAVAFAVTWLGLSMYRFQVYSLYESVEESLRRTCTILNEFEGWLSIPLDEWTENTRSDVVKDCASRAWRELMCAGIYGKEIQDLRSMFMKAGHDGLRFENDSVVLGNEAMKVEHFDEVLRAGKEKADRLLGACRDEKQKLEGCFKGNWLALILLFQRRPLSKKMIVNVCSKRADDPTEKLTWRGVEGKGAA